MKKRILIGAMTCWMALNAQAQFQYDRALPMPTRDLYDTGVMNMYMRALAKTTQPFLIAASKSFSRTVPTEPF